MTYSIGVYLLLDSTSEWSASELKIRVPVKGTIEEKMGSYHVLYKGEGRNRELRGNVRRDKTIRNSVFHMLHCLVGHVV